MAHREEREFCTEVQNKLPEYFKQKKVLDCGSLDINGNNRYLFTDCDYTGIDIGPGKNVDIVSTIHEFEAPDSTYDLIISTECFEHDMHYQQSLLNIIRMLKSKGMFLFTCATTGRPEHGTRKTSQKDAPLLFGEWSDYYKNLTEEDIRKVLSIEEIFSEFEFRVHTGHKDLFFYGLKK
jgi:SAM-dependent methyltransferase